MRQASFGFVMLAVITMIPWNSMRLLSFLLVFGMSISGFLGFIEFGRLKIDLNDFSIYCEFRGHRFELNQKLDFPEECFGCSCTGSGYECVGYGTSAGVIAPPKGCKMKVVNCTARFVSEENESEPCSAAP